MSAVAGKRVFILEDEPIIAMTLEDMLEELGCTLAGSAGSIDEGTRLAHSVDADVAILDVNVNGERSEAVAAILKGRAIPYLFATGYGASAAGEGENAPVVSKPYDMKALERAMIASLGTP